MAHYAEINPQTKEVIRTIVCDYTYIRSLPLNDRKNWIAYDKDGSHPACIGGTYYPEVDKFLEEKPYDSWVLNTEYYKWQAPIPMPSVGIPTWDEDLYKSDNTRGWVIDTPVGIASTSDAQELP